MSTNQETNTDASTVGMVPDTVGVVLLTLVCGGILLFGSRLGYQLSDLGLICLSGIAAAIGVRVATDGTTRQVVAGVITLWIAMLVFAGGTVSLVLQQLPAAGLDLLTPLLVAAVALLGPFGILSNTIRTYGQGAGSDVLGRYLAGTVVLVVIGTAYAAFVLLQLLDFSHLLADMPGGGEILAVFDALVVQIVTAVVVYAVFLFVLPRTAGALPVELFVAATDLDRVNRFRDGVKKGTTYGWWALGVYVLLVVAVFMVRAAPDDVAGTTETLVEFGEDILVPLVSLLATPLLVGAIGGLIAIFVATLFLLWLIRSVSTVSGGAVAEAGGPPLVLVGTIVLVTQVDGLVPLGEIEPLVADIAEPGTVQYELIISSPSLLLLFASMLALLISGIVLTLPAAIGGMTPADQSLTGVIAGVASLTILVLVAITAGEPIWLLVFGVALVAVVWELGEYTTVAAGELRSRSTDSQLPAGFTTIVSVHAVGTLCVTALGSLLLLITVPLLAGITLSLTAALLVAGITVSGLSVLLLLLTG